jgi:hypothetical protein
MENTNETLNKSDKSALHNYGYEALPINTLKLLKHKQ